MSRIHKSLPLQPESDADLERELAFQRSLTTAQRFEMMPDASRLSLEMLIRNGYKKPFEIVKRK